MNKLNLTFSDFGEYSPIYARTGSSEEWWGQDHGEILHQVPYQVNKLERFFCKKNLEIKF
jgi:hypothetical protein